jgi:DNA helicase-2/ATP-dependent DNA helicase PcrA
LDSGISDGIPTDYGFSDFVVLCRSSFMFDLFKEAFSNHGIPAEIVETTSTLNSEPGISIIRLIKRYFYNRHIHSEFLEISNDAIRMIDNLIPIEDVVKNISSLNNITDKDISRLINLAKICGNRYEDFFRKINTREGIDDFDERAEAVTLMTIHASKGLEFENVFIPGCEDNIIPFELFGKLDDTKFAEEERLLYVGITRSRQNLYLSWSHKRNYNGKIFDQKKSRFLDRIEKELAVETKRQRNQNDPSRQLDLF